MLCVLASALAHLLEEPGDVIYLMAYDDPSGLDGVVLSDVVEREVLNLFRRHFASLLLRGRRCASNFDFVDV